MLAAILNHMPPALNAAMMKSLVQSANKLNGHTLIRLFISELILKLLFEPSFTLLLALNMDSNQRP